MFRLSSQKNGIVKEPVVWQQNAVAWNFRWRRQLSNRECVCLNDLMQFLSNVSLRQEVSDSWVWLDTTTGIYSIQSAYRAIQRSPAVENDPVFKVIWSTPVPSNSSVFAWRVALDHIQTNSNMRQRNTELGSLGFRCVLRPFHILNSPVGLPLARTDTKLDSKHP